MLVTRVGKMEKEGIEEPGGSGSSGNGEEPRGQRLVESSGSGGVNVNTSLTPVSCSPPFLPSFFPPSFFLSPPSPFFHYFELTLQPWMALNFPCPHLPNMGLTSAGHHSQDGFQKLPTRGTNVRNYCY